MATKRSRKFRWKQEWFVEPIGEDSNKSIAELLGGDPTSEMVEIVVNGEKVRAYKCPKSFMPVLHQSKNVYYRGFMRRTSNTNPRPDPYNSRIP